MTTHPITLTPSQLRAALAGRLEQVRVPVEPQPEHKQFHEYSGVVIHDSDHRMWCWNDLVLENIWDFPDGEDRKTLASRCPWGVVGDRLYVREQWRTGANLDKFTPAQIFKACEDAGYVLRDGRTRDEYKPCPIKYEVDGALSGSWSMEDFGGVGKLRLAQNSPRWASRLTFDITGIRVERLQDMSEADAYRCGVERLEFTSGVIPGVVPPWNKGHPLTSTYLEAFYDDWNKQHGNALSAASTWTWVLDVRKVGE